MSVAGDNDLAQSLWAVDQPHANTLTVHVLAAVAEHERVACQVASPRLDGNHRIER
jgi:hypothetical protein